MLYRAIYFLHSKRTSVTWLLSYCAVPCVTRIRRFVYGLYCPGELIPTEKMETKHPTEKLFGSEFPSICNHCGIMAARSRRTLQIFKKFFALFWKTTPCSKLFKILFRKFSSRHRPTCCVQISWNLVDGKSVKSCVVYQTKKQNFAWLRSCRYCADHIQNLTELAPLQLAQSVPDFIQIGSLSAVL